MNCNHTTENEISLFNQYLLSVWVLMTSCFVSDLL